jgi:hypothetical protein
MNQNRGTRDFTVAEGHGHPLVLIMTTKGFQEHIVKILFKVINGILN